MIELEVSSGSLELDLMLDSMRAFVRNDPAAKEEKSCPVCDRPESEQPTIFRDGLGCCDLCRKVHRGELSLTMLAGFKDNLTKNSE